MPWVLSVLACRLDREIGSDSAKMNTDAHLELIRGDALPELTSKPEVVLRGRNHS